MRKIRRHRILSDDRAHVIGLTSDPLGVAADSEVALVFWSEYSTERPESQRVFRVFATGEDVPEYAKYIGTVYKEGDLFARHLYELAEWLPVPLGGEVDASTETSKA